MHGQNHMKFMVPVFRETSHAYL